MEDIIINGINLAELQKNIHSIRKEASRLISENIRLAITLSKEIAQSKSKEEIKEKAVKAYEALQKANFISDVSGITCVVPYNSSYSGDYDEDTISATIEDSENEVLNEVYKEDNALSNLVNLAYDMEYETKQWNASAC